MRWRWIAVLLVTLLSIWLIWMDQAHRAARNRLRLPGVFGDHMVMQRRQPLLIWGWDAPDQLVTVRFAGQEKQVKTPGDGRWEIWLDPVDTRREPQQLEIRGSGHKIFKDILVGEVWLCAGQSNMEFGITKIPESRTAIEQARHPDLRLAWVPRRTEAQPQNQLEFSWAPCTPRAIARQGPEGFSAIAYYFGLQLREELDVPIGLIQAAFGGSSCEAWISRSALGRKPELKPVLQRHDFLAEQDPHKGSSLVYNAMVHPLVGFNLRGAAWYQGEQNVSYPESYHTLLLTLLEDWRALWQRDPAQFPFLIIQLPPYDYTRLNAEFTGNLAVIQEAQGRVYWNDPHAHLIVTTDLGDPDRIHPPDKQPVGKRLAETALDRVYQHANGSGQGPEIRRFDFYDGRARVQFNTEHLTTRDGAPPRLFSLAGEDRQFHPAQGVITNGIIELQAPEVPDPVALRYGYNTLKPSNLCDEHGLPAMPFRTDDWSLKTP